MVEAASTTKLNFFNDLAVFSRRLHYFSTVHDRSVSIEQPDRRIQGRGTQMHIALRRGQVLVPRQFLDGPGGSPLHRQVRAERMPQRMDAAPLEPRPPHRPGHRCLDALLRERLPLGIADDPLAAQVPSLAQGCLEPSRQRDVSRSPPLGRGHLALPLRPRDGQWGEMDTTEHVWTIPATRMKMKREHRVPLCGRALAILAAARTLGDGPLVFTSRHGRRLDLKQLRLLLERCGIAAVPHGFRSSFRDWAAEETDHPREVVEAALAHRVQNPVEAAYARSDLFERRRRLMNDWAAYLDGARGQAETLR